MGALTMASLAREEWVMLAAEGRTLILVAVGASPSSASLVRWAVREAERSGGECQALHIDTGQALQVQDRRRLDGNLSLARVLGARVRVVAADDPVKAILEAARESGAAMIVVGRSGLGSIGSRLFASRAISDRVVREAGPIPVAIIQDREDEPQAAWTGGATVRVKALEFLCLTVFLVGPLAILRALDFPLFSYRAIALLYLAVIVLLSLFVRPALIVASAIASALALNFFLIPPYYTFSIGSPEDWLLFATYFLVAFVTGGLVARVRSRDRLLAQGRRAATFLLRASESLAALATIDLAREKAMSLAEEYFGKPIAFYAGSPETARNETAGLPLAPPDIMACLSRMEDSGNVAEFDYGTGSRIRIVPGFAAGRADIVATVEIQGREVWTVADDDVLASLAGTLALIVERARSEESSRMKTLELRTQKLAKVLLDSVSHEIRTPLTMITGALSALRDDGLAERPESRRTLLDDALDASKALNRIVEDLLAAGRMESGALKLKRELVDPVGLVEDALAEASEALAGRAVEVIASPDLRPVDLDSALVTRLVVNILRNAGKYSRPGSPVRVQIGQDERTLSLRVVDEGPGVPQERLDTLFDKFRREDRRGGGGLGLGLAICKGIAEAHGGSIMAETNAEGFAVVALFPGVVMQPHASAKGEA